MIDNSTYTKAYTIKWCNYSAIAIVVVLSCLTDRQTYIFIQYLQFQMLQWNLMHFVKMHIKLFID